MYCFNFCVEKGQEVGAFVIGEGGCKVSELKVENSVCVRGIGVERFRVEFGAGLIEGSFVCGDSLYRLGHE